MTQQLCLGLQPGEASGTHATGITGPRGIQGYETGNFSAVNKMSLHNWASHTFFPHLLPSAASVWCFTAHCRNKTQCCNMDQGGTGPCLACTDLTEKKKPNNQIRLDLCSQILLTVSLTSAAMPSLPVLAGLSSSPINSSLCPPRSLSSLGLVLSTVSAAQPVAHRLWAHRCWALLGEKYLSSTVVCFKIPAVSVSLFSSPAMF